MIFAGGCGEKKPAPTALQPPDVDVVNVIQQDVPIYSEWIGTTHGLVNAVIRAQVTGYLLKRNYKEGSFVRKGDLLFEIDPRTFQASLDQAQGQLAAAKARLGKTELDVKRFTPLAKQSAISQQELDDAIQANLSAKAGIQSTAAAVETARLNLGFTRIASPIDGIAGAANAQMGDLVGPGQIGELTTVSTVDPIQVNFAISEQEYMGAADAIAKGQERGAEVTEGNLELILADGSVFPQRGKFYFAGRQVDAKTGTIQIAALFPNPGNILRPGQYARVRALSQTRKGAVLAPQRSVTELQGNFQVAVVRADNKVAIRPVKVGERVGSLWVIKEGLKPGERVVVEGIQKVKDGMPVNPKPVAAETEPGAAAPAKSPAQPAQTPTPKKD
jgi:membrane fusion protein (multidrug efflux system)